MTLVGWFGELVGNEVRVRNDAGAGIVGDVEMGG